MVLMCMCMFMYVCMYYPCILYNHMKRNENFHLRLSLIFTSYVLF